LPATLNDFVRIQRSTSTCLPRNEEFKANVVNYLGVDEGSKNGDGGSERVDGLNGRLEDYDGRDNDRNPLHGVADAECQRRDLIQRHVGHLVVQVVEHALRRHPPTSTEELLAT
jgi:hypothetical protein